MRRPGFVNCFFVFFVARNVSPFVSLGDSKPDGVELAGTTARVLAGDRTRGRQPSCGGSRPHDACQRFWLVAQRAPAWGEPAPPRLAPGGNGKGGLDSSLPQAISALLVPRSRRNRPSPVPEASELSRTCRTGIWIVVHPSLPSALCQERCPLWQDLRSRCPLGFCVVGSRCHLIGGFFPPKGTASRVLAVAKPRVQRSLGRRASTPAQLSAGPNSIPFRPCCCSSSLRSDRRTIETVRRSPTSDAGSPIAFEPPPP